MAMGNRTGNILAWIMLMMVIVGLGGFGLTNFGGSVTSIGRVGDQEISTTDYGQALQQALQNASRQLGRNVPFQQALTFGIDQQVRAQLVTTAALDNQAEKLGLSVGNDRLSAEVTGMSAFHGADGKFDRSTYAFVLKQNGMTEPAFEKKIRSEITRRILQNAVAGGVEAPAIYADTLVGYIGEERGFTWLKLGQSNLPAPLAEPDDAALKAYYDAHHPEFTAPETKVITYVALLPEAEAAKVEVSDKEVADLYAQRKAQYDKPEKRLVERLVYPTEADAQAAKAKLDAGTATFEQLVEARGLKPADIDLGAVTEAQLGKAGSAVFGLTAPGVTGPVMSDLGPALFRMNGIIAAQSRTLDEARAELTDEIRKNKAVHMISDQVETVNDKLAGGATLEDLAKETGMQLGHMDFTAESSDGLAADPAFHDAAAKAKTDDYPAVIQLKNGGIAALRLDQTRAPALIPFDKVADKVRAGWTAEALAKALKARADDIMTAVKGGGVLASFGLVTDQAPITRDAAPEGAPKSLVDEAFKLAANGDMATVTEGDAAYIVRLNSVAPPKADDPDMKKMHDQLAAQGNQALGDDIFTLYASAITAESGVELDQAAINAVHAQFH